MVTIDDVARYSVVWSEPLSTTFAAHWVYTAGSPSQSAMMQTIVFTGDKPTLATAAIGSSMIPETIKLVLTITGQGLDLATVQAAPPLMSNFILSLPGQSAEDRGVVIPDGAYSVQFVKNLEAMGVKLTKIPTSTANGLRGTVVAVQIDLRSGERHTVETPGVLVFGGAE
jgi:gamma-glutamyltranspeptidase / glutathione hydrolase